MQNILENISNPDEVVTQENEILKPEIKELERGETYGKFALEPLERGFGATLGNPLRRVLLSSLSGAAVTWVKIDGVLHEYSNIPHVKEDVTEFLLNVKGIRFRSLTQKPSRMRLEITGEGKVSAGDIMTSSDLEIVNPELSLAILDSEQAKISVEFNVELGKGYLAAEPANGPSIGVLPVDAIFTPVRKVNYTVERTRVGQRTDYERLLLEIWTDGSITPKEALKQAALILVEHLFIFTATDLSAGAGKKKPSLAAAIPVEQYNISLEHLQLSARTKNSLKRAGIGKVGEVLERSSSELLKVRNFGEKSLSELYSKLTEIGVLPQPSEEEEAEAVATPATAERELGLEEKADET
ncbi:MAG: DNA-directed RNA polymerase subunit alpha [Chloroflexi bacterium]|nr:DNA-directed RNA polymerase subunit alpha [Chloroflexota bacterium]